MKKLILLGFLTLMTLSHAKMLNGIALIVNGESITTAEIRAVQKRARVSKEQAIEMLIGDRLQQIAMKDITISEDAIDEKVAQIAKQNNLTIKQMQKILKKQHTSWSSYRSKIKLAMKKEQFFKTKVLASITEPSEYELELFYNKHKKAFTVPKTIKVHEYTTPSQSRMKQFLKSKNLKGITKRTLTKSTSKLNPAMLATLLATPNGGFTTSFNTGSKYVSYKVLSKQGQRILPFESAKGIVASKWKQQQQTVALKEYFEKMRTDAQIQKVRQ